MGGSFSKSHDSDDEYNSPDNSCAEYLHQPPYYCNQEQAKRQRQREQVDESSYSSDVEPSYDTDEEDAYWEGRMGEVREDLNHAIEAMNTYKKTIDQQYAQGKEALDSLKTYHSVDTTQDEKNLDNLYEAAKNVTVSLLFWATDYRNFSSFVETLQQLLQHAQMAASLIEKLAESKTFNEEVCNSTKMALTELVTSARETDSNDEIIAFISALEAEKTAIDAIEKENAQEKREEIICKKFLEAAWVLEYLTEHHQIKEFREKLAVLRLIKSSPAPTESQLTKFIKLHDALIGEVKPLLLQQREQLIREARCLIRVIKDVTPSEEQKDFIASLQNNNSKPYVVPSDANGICKELNSLRWSIDDLKRKLESRKESLKITAGWERAPASLKKYNAALFKDAPKTAPDPMEMVLIIPKQNNSTSSSSPSPCQYAR